MMNDWVLYVALGLWAAATAYLIAALRSAYARMASDRDDFWAMQRQQEVRHADWRKHHEEAARREADALRLAGINYRKSRFDWAQAARCAAKDTRTAAAALGAAISRLHEAEADVQAAFDAYAEIVKAVDERCQQLYAADPTSARE